MKYLLQAIEAKRSSVKLADSELRDLLTEVCKGRDEREEFLESIDRIITELKNYTEHSTAFLSKVSKRDAPDYYDVIKHPMDLGTMQKKVKSGQYKTKKQFAADLELIWENCLTYNSDPSHPLRRNVAFMRKKANHLLEFIGEKSEVRDVLGQWGTNKPQSAEIKARGEEKGARVNGKAEKEGEERKRKKRREEGVKFEDQEAFIRTPASMMDFARIDAGLSVVEQGMAAGAGPSSRPMMTTLAMQPLEAINKIKADAEEEQDPLSTVLSSIFAPPLQRGKGKEKATPEPQSQTHSDAGSVNANSNHTATGLDISPLDASADWFTVTTSQHLMTGALPALHSSIRVPATSPDQEVDAARGRKRRKKPYHLIPATRRKGLQGKYARNIRTLHKVQATHAKFLSLAHFVENEAPIPAYLTSMSSDEESDYPSDVEDDHSSSVPFESTRNPFTRISAESAREHASYNTRLILAHRGFEGGHRSAVDVLTETLGEFLSNMGRMLRLYSDRYATSMSAEEMILHTLQETQGTSVHSLENYIRNDVERYGTKMSDLLRKLRSSYREQFTLSTERGRGVIEDEALFADNGEALVAGNFAEDLGDDYFGFKELGLDREVGLSGLTVPSRLFYGRGKNPALLAKMGGGEATKENVLPYPPPPEPIPLVASAIGEQIGLLQPFYQEKLREHRQRTKHAQEFASTKAQEEEEDREGKGEEVEKDWVLESNTLPDQEQEKQRYKVPPTGKMPRRIIWSTATERKWLIDREREKLDREKAEQAAAAAGAGLGGVTMSTGGAGSGAGGSKGKVKKSGITA